MIGEEKTVVAETTHENASLVRVHGDLDGDSAPDLVGALTRAVRSGTARTVVDVSDMGFADSAVLHALLGARQAHLDAGVPLIVAGPLSTEVRRLLDITGTAEAFLLAADVDEALAMTC